MFMSDGWKVHWCPTALLPGLMEDSVARAHGEGAFESVTKGFIDLPGMILQDRAIETLKLEGFTLRIPSEDFEHFYDSLKEKKVRKFNDGREYFKIHGWLHCVVFTPELRDACLELMRNKLTAAKKRGEDDRARFRSAIAKVNADGVKVISAKAPDSIPKAALSGKPNKEKN